MATLPKGPGLYLLGIQGCKKAYVGSTVNLHNRARQHEGDLKNGVHGNKHLQAAFNKHRGEVLFMPVPVEPGEDTLKLEQELLDEFHPTGVLMNICKDVSAPTRGMKRSEEAIEKSRQAMTGRKHSEETLQKLREIAKARGMPRSVIEAGVAARVGKKLSLEHVEKVRETSRQRMEDPAAREHLRQVNLGIPHTPEAIEKMKAVCAGRVFSPQALAAQKVAIKKYWEKKKASNP